MSSVNIIIGCYALTRWRKNWTLYAYFGGDGLARTHFQSH